MSTLKVIHDRYGTLVVNESGVVVNRFDVPADAERYVQQVYERRRVLMVAEKTAKDPARRAVNAAVLALIERHQDEYEQLRRGFLDEAC